MSWHSLRKRKYTPNMNAFLVVYDESMNTGCICTHTHTHTQSQAARGQRREQASQKSLTAADKQVTKFLQAKILEQITGEKR